MSLALKKPIKTDVDEEDNDTNPDIYRLITMINGEIGNIFYGLNEREEVQEVDTDENRRLAGLMDVAAIPGQVGQTRVKPSNGAPHNRLVEALLFIRNFIKLERDSRKKKQASVFNGEYVALLDIVINDNAMKSRKNWTGKKSDIDRLMWTFIDYVITNHKKNNALHILTQLLYIIFGKSLSDQRQFSTTVRAIPEIKKNNIPISTSPRTICHTIQESVNTAFISADNAAVAGFLLMQCSNDYLMHAHTVKATIGGEKQPIMIQRGEVWALSILCELASSGGGIQMFGNIINAYMTYLDSGAIYTADSYGTKLTEDEINSIFSVFKKIAIDTSPPVSTSLSIGSDSPIPPVKQTGINTFCSKIKTIIIDQKYNTNSKLIEECFNQLFAKSGEAFNQHETDLHGCVCSFIEELSSIGELNETCLLFAKLLKTVAVFNPTLAKDIDVSHWAKHIADEVYTGLWGEGETRGEGETSITPGQSHTNKEYNNCLDALIIPLLDMICHDFESLPSIIKLMEYISTGYNVKNLIQNRNNPGKSYDVVNKIKSYQHSNGSIKTTEDAVLTVCCDVALSFCATLVDGKIRVRLDHQHNLFLDHEIIGMKVPCVDISFLYTSILKTSLANVSVNKRLYCTIDLGKANMEPFAEFLRAIPLNTCVTALSSAATTLENALGYIEKGGNAADLRQVLKDTSVVVIRSPADDVDPGGKYMGKPYYIDSEPVVYHLEASGITVIIEEVSRHLNHGAANTEWLKYMIDNTSTSGQYIFPHSSNLVQSLNGLLSHDDNEKIKNKITDYYTRAAGPDDKITLNDYYTGEIDLALGTLLNTIWEPTKIKEKLCNTMKQLKNFTYRKYLDNRTRGGDITIDISRDVALVVLKRAIPADAGENDHLKIGVVGVSDVQKHILKGYLEPVVSIFNSIHDTLCVTEISVGNIIMGFLSMVLFSDMNNLGNEITAQVYVSLLSRVVGDISTIDNQIPRTGSVRFRGMISEDTDSVSVEYYTSKAKGKGKPPMFNSALLNELARKSSSEQHITHTIRPIDTDRAVGLGFGTPVTGKVKVISTSFSAQKPVGISNNSPDLDIRRYKQMSDMRHWQDGPVGMVHGNSKGMGLPKGTGLRFNRLGDGSGDQNMQQDDMTGEGEDGSVIDPLYNRKRSPSTASTKSSGSSGSDSTIKKHPLKKAMIISTSAENTNLALLPQVAWVQAPGAQAPGAQVVPGAMQLDHNTSSYLPSIKSRQSDGTRKAGGAPVRGGHTNTRRKRKSNANHKRKNKTRRTMPHKSKNKSNNKRTRTRTRTRTRGGSRSNTPVTSLEQ